MAKQIDFPEKDVLSLKEYNKLIGHLKNSALWYATNMDINSGQLKQRFRDKGLPEGEFKVQHEDEIIEHDFYREIIEFLEQGLLIDDERYAEYLIEREFRKGKSISAVKSTLWLKKVDSDLAAEMLEKYLDSTQAEDDRYDALERIYSRVERTMKYKKAVDANESSYVIKNMFIKAMASKGFSFSDINDFLEEKDYFS